MSVFVIHVVSDQVVTNFDSQDLRHEFSHYIALKNRNDAAYFEIRKRWRRGELPEVVSMMPAIEGTVAVHGKLVPVMGFDFIANFSGYGVLDTTQSSLSKLLVKDGLIAFGNAISGQQEIGGARVVASFPSRQNLLIGDIATVQAVLERPSELDTVWLRTKLETTRPWYSKLVPGIETALKLNFDTPELDGYVVNSMDAMNPSRHFNLSISFNLGQLGLLAMFVAAFIFYQAMCINLDRRQREFDRLNTLGVADSQITLVVCIEAVALSIFGTFLGLVMSWAFLVFFTVINVDQVWNSFTWWSVGKSCGLAILLAAIGSFQARQTSSPKTTLKTRAIVAAVCVLAILFGFSAHSGLFGAFLLIGALCVLTAFVSVPFILWLLTTRQSKWVFGSVLTRMTIRSALETIKSVRMIVAAFAIAVAMPMGIGLMVDSLRINFDALLDERLTPGLYIDHAVNVDTSTLAQMKGISDVREYRRGSALIQTGAVDVTISHLDQWELDRYRAPSNVGDGGVLINEFATRTQGLRVGDMLEMQLPGGKRLELPVNHVFSDFGASSARIILPDNLGIDGFVRDRLTVLGSGFALAQVESELRRQHPEAEFSRTDSIRTLAIRIFQTTFALTLAMSNVSLIVATLGLACSLFILSSQQDVTFRLLHGIGVTQPRLAVSSMVQCLIMGGVAVLCAVPLSIGIAWTLCELMNPRAFNSTINLTFSIQQFLVPGTMGLLAAVIAGLAPLRSSLRRVVNQPSIDVL